MTRTLLLSAFLAGCAGSNTSPPADATRSDLLTPAPGPNPPSLSEAPPDRSALPQAPLEVKAALTVYGHGQILASGDFLVLCGGTSTCDPVLGLDGETVTIKTEAFEGEALHQWEGDCSGAAATCTLTLDARRPPTILAWFGPTGVDPPPKPLVHMLVHVRGSGLGTITIDDYEFTTPCVDVPGGACLVLVPVTAVVTLHAEPSPGSRFGNWSDGSLRPSITLTARPPRARAEEGPAVTVVFDSAPAAPRYRLERIEVDGRPVQAVALRAGWLAGSVAEPAGRTQRSFVAKAGSSEVELLPPGFRVDGLDASGRPFGVRDDGTSCALLDGNVVVAIPNPHGDDECRLLEVDDRGRAFGWSRRIGDVGYTPFYFDGTSSIAFDRPDQFRLLAMGEDGELAGSMTDRRNQATAAIVSRGQLLLIAPSLTSSRITAVGAGGRVVGQHETTWGNRDEAFYWDGTRVVDLGLVLDLSWSNANPAAVNGDGVIVGSVDRYCLGCDSPGPPRAFVIIDGVGRDLNALVETGGIELEGAYDVDEEGRILAGGADWRAGGSRVHVLLAPVCDSADESCSQLPASFATGRGEVR